MPTLLLDLDCIQWDRLRQARYCHLFLSADIPTTNLHHPQVYLNVRLGFLFPVNDTDDDLIPSELASKNYIPDPALAIPTTPPSRNLLIWDPTTRSGLPAGLPSFDSTTRTTRCSDADDFPLPR
jgi:hypothetical protein